LTGKDLGIKQCFLEKQRLIKSKSFHRNVPYFFDRRKNYFGSEISGKGWRGGKRLRVTPEYLERRVFAQMWDASPRLHLKEYLISTRLFYYERPFS